MKRHKIILQILFTALAATLVSACSTSIVSVQNHQGTNAYNLGPEVNSASDDYAPYLVGDRLLYTSNRPTVEGYIQGDDFWFTDRDRREWGPSLNRGGKFNSTGDEGAAFITPDGESVFFVQCWTEDGLGDCDIYSASIDNQGKWNNVRNLGAGVNSSDWDSHPFVSPDGEYLYFSSDRSGGEGGADLWRCKRLRSGKWGKPQNLGSVINTSGDEKTPTIAPNGEDLYFSSTGHAGLGGFDLFVSKPVASSRRSGWSDPVNLGTPFNSPEDDMFFRLSAREDTVFISSRREEGRGGLDLYQVYPNPFKDSLRYTYYVRGMVFDTVTEMGIANAKIDVRPAKGAPFTIRANSSGKYSFKTELSAQYEMTATAEKYTEERVQFTVPAELYYNEYRKSVGLAPLRAEKAAPVEDTRPDLTVAYFEFDKSDVLPRFRQQLEMLVEEELKPMQESGRTFEVQLDAHTDDRGTEEYNYALSRRRGASVSKVLQELGVPLDAIRINAYGEKRPVSKETDDDSRQMNRRVEVRILANPEP